MFKPLLIGLHGKARSGKDTVAALLIKKYNLLRYGPSVRVKMTTATMFDFPVAYLDDDKMKDQMDPFWGMTYRQMAQKVGKESSRDVFGDDIWMRHVEKKMQQIKVDRNDPKNKPVPPSMACDPWELDWHVPAGMILADIRYPSEAVWVREHGGSVLFLIRDNAQAINGFEGHEGEKGLSLDLADAVIYNNGTIEELYAQVNAVLNFDDDSCCDNEKRNMNGGCDNCGDPSF